MGGAKVNGGVRTATEPRSTADDLEPKEADAARLTDAVTGKRGKSTTARTGSTRRGAQPDGDNRDVQVIVQEGSVDDVLAWVGDDVNRARAALTVENARGNDARTTLQEQLKKIAEPQQ